MGSMNPESGPSAGVGLEGGFVLAAGVALALAGLTMTVVSMGSAPLLGTEDPVAGWRLGYSVLAWGLIWSAVGVVCVCVWPTVPGRWTGALLVAWAGSNVLFYRAGLEWLGWRRDRAYAGLGTLTNLFGIDTGLAEGLLVGLAACLVTGSIVVMGCLWVRERQARQETFLRQYKERRRR